DDTQGHESRFKARKQSAYRAHGAVNPWFVVLNVFNVLKVALQPSHFCSLIRVWNTCKPLCGNPYQGVNFRIARDPVVNDSSPWLLAACSLRCSLSTRSRSR